MSIHASLPPFRRDGRANRLESWTTTDSGAGHFVWLRTADEVAAQLRMLAPEYSVRQVPTNAVANWTHLFWSSGALRLDVAEMFDALSIALTLACPSTLDVAIALDWYKQPVDGVHPTNWPNTEIGELVNLGKYRYKTDGDRQTEIGRNLMPKLSGVIERHPLLRHADVVLDVPGHDTERVSFGSRMAVTVARDFQMGRVRVRARDKFRAEAKSLNPDQRADVLVGQFSVYEDLRGKSALIVDDVFHSGASMGEAARAAREAGAHPVLGISAARTLRR